ncbi:MAG: hypothetical protein WCS55_04625 [Sulfuricurvum sp.]|uniref:hypothetical protein n=1 Tax=Sulfuricurvum sp. TaxID=2025608 RepID=UPI00356784C2
MNDLQRETLRSYKKELKKIIKKSKRMLDEIKNELDDEDSLIHGGLMGFSMSPRGQLKDSSPFTKYHLIDVNLDPEAKFTGSLPYYERLAVNLISIGFNPEIAYFMAYDLSLCCWEEEQRKHDHSPSGENILHCTLQEAMKALQAGNKTDLLHFLEEKPRWRAYAEYLQMLHIHNVSKTDSAQLFDHVRRTVKSDYRRKQ